MVIRNYRLERPADVNASTQGFQPSAFSDLLTIAFNKPYALDSLIINFNSVRDVPIANQRWQTRKAFLYVSLLNNALEEIPYVNDIFSSAEFPVSSSTTIHTLNQDLNNVIHPTVPVRGVRIKGFNLWFTSSVPAGDPITTFLNLQLQEKK